MFEIYIPDLINKLNTSNSNRFTINHAFWHNWGLTTTLLESSKIYLLEANEYKYNKVPHLLIDIQIQMGDISFSATKPYKEKDIHSYKVYTTFLVNEELIKASQTFNKSHFSNAVYIDSKLLKKIIQISS